MRDGSGDFERSELRDGSGDFDSGTRDGVADGTPHTGPPLSSVRWPTSPPVDGLALRDGSGRCDSTALRDGSGLRAGSGRCDSTALCEGSGDFDRSELCEGSGDRDTGPCEGPGDFDRSELCEGSGLRLTVGAQLTVPAGVPLLAADAGMPTARPNVTAAATDRAAT